MDKHTSTDIETVLKHFLSNLTFTDKDIKSYCEEFDIPESTMRNMGKRITRELKDDLESLLAK